MHLTKKEIQLIKTLTFIILFRNMRLKKVRVMQISVVKKLVLVRSCFFLAQWVVLRLWVSPDKKSNTWIRQRRLNSVLWIRLWLHIMNNWACVLVVSPRRLKWISRKLPVTSSGRYNWDSAGFGWILLRYKKGTVIWPFLFLSQILHCNTVCDDSLRTKK